MYGVGFHSFQIFSSTFSKFAIALVFLRAIIMLVTGLLINHGTRFIGHPLIM